MSDKIRVAAKELDGLGLSYDAGQRLERAKRLADLADNTTPPLKGFVLYQAVGDLAVVIAEAAASP